ncbi:MAG: hypothetical protein IK099_09695 [Clostridia bacterium]|nr:hypothetical protein [Clostridia bacterium]
MNPFDDFISRKFSDDENVFWLHGEKMDIGGGRLTFEEIDRLAGYPQLDTVRISGVNQKTFEYFIARYGKQFKRIHFFKCKLVQDWACLSDLPNLECLSWFWNQRIDSLWDMSNNVSLTALHISNFTRLHSLSGIEKAKNLRLFSVGDAIWESMIIQSLMPLAGMPLECLAWQGKHIMDQDLSFIPALKRLQWFFCAINQFSTEQCAWVSANCPHADGRIFHPYESWENGMKAAIIGKRKPVLNVQGNEERIQKYVDKYQTLKKQYAGIPYREAFPDLFAQTDMKIKEDRV